MTAAKTAKNTSSASDKPEKGNAMPTPTAADAQHPDVHPSRHGAGGMAGMTEPNTGGNVEQNPGGEPPAKNLTPMIGANASDADTGLSVIDTEALTEQDHVYSHEQALNLPVVEKGTPVRAPSEAQKKKSKDAAIKTAKEAYEDEKSDPDATDESKRAAKATYQAAKTAPDREPVLAFKDKHRRTMLVVKTKDGLAAMPAPAFADVVVPA